MRVLIISGGNFSKEFLADYLGKNDFDYVIAADKGLAYAQMLNVTVDLILGDFDSLNSAVLEDYKKRDIPIAAFAPEKDYTDTHLAIETAVEKGADDITVLCGTGTRLDHTIANIGLMQVALDKGVSCKIIDEHNQIRMIDKSITLNKNELFGDFVSLIPYTEKVTGVTLTGFRYPLNDSVLKIGESIGISNELLEAEGEIRLKDGILLVIDSND